MARPRDPELDARIFTAAQAIATSEGLDAVTVAAVADHAGVGRPTVYRRWPTRAALLFELELIQSIPPELPDLGSFHDDLVAAIRHLHLALVASDRGVLGERLGAIVTDAEFAAEVWEHRWTPDRERVYEVWARALARGELDPAVDGRAVIDDVVGVTLFRTLFWHTDDDVWIEPFVARLCDGVLRRR